MMNRTLIGILALIVMTAGCRKQPPVVATPAPPPATASADPAPPPAPVRTYLISLGIPGNRVRTVSYGKEYPFDPGHTEEAWASNRRGHFVITSR